MADTPDVTGINNNPVAEKIREFLDILQTPDHNINRGILQYFLQVVTEKLLEHRSYDDIIEFLAQFKPDDEDDSDDDNEEIVDVNSYGELWALVDQGKLAVGQNVNVHITGDLPDDETSTVKYSTKLVFGKEFFCDDEIANEITRNCAEEKGIILVDNPLQDEERIFRTLSDGTTHEIQVQYLEDFVAHVCRISV